MGSERIDEAVLKGRSALDPHGRRERERFLGDFLTESTGTMGMPRPNITPISQRAEEIDWTRLQSENQSFSGFRIPPRYSRELTALYGQYIINPDLQSLDWSAIDSRRVVSISDDLRKNVVTAPGSAPLTIGEMADYVSKRYSPDHLIPGIEYWQWLLEHPDKLPPMVGDSMWTGVLKLLFLGSPVRDVSGRWDIPTILISEREGERQIEPQLTPLNIMTWGREMLPVVVKKL